MSKRLKKLSALLAATMLVGTVVGCSQGAGSSSETDKNVAASGEKGKLLYFIPIVDTGAYWSPMKKGAEDKAKELGYELVSKTTPPSEAQKNERHIGFVDEAIAKKAAGIALAPMDPDMFDRKAKEAMDSGIKLVTFDADVKTEENRTAYIGTDNKLAGEELGKKGAEYLKAQGITKGSIALVATNLTQTTMTYRQEGIEKGFAEVMGADAANFKWLEPIQDNDQAAESKRLLEGQITSNKDMVAVFSLGSEGPDTGVMEAIKSQGKGGQIHHFGFDYTPTWENGINDGLITGIVDQDAYNIGQTVIEILVKSIEGEAVDAIYPIDVQWVESKDIVKYGETKQSQFSTETTE
ncbi:sugar ABC transporter substrate-binding protein [Clostridioides difficile]